MIKISDARAFVSKKITRNNEIINIFDNYSEILEKEISIKKTIQKTLQEQKDIIHEINQIEQAQCLEYTIARQNKIGELMKHISGYTPSEDIITAMSQIEVLRNDIGYHKSIIKYLEEQIPDKGVATNYTISLCDLSKTCR